MSSAAEPRQYMELTAANRRQHLRARMLELEHAHFAATVRRVEAEHDDATPPDVIEATDRDLASLDARLTALTGLLGSLPTDAPAADHRDNVMEDR